MSRGNSWGGLAMSGSPVAHHPTVRQNQAAVGWKTRFPGEIGHARLNVSVNEEAAGSAVWPWPLTCPTAGFVC